MSWDSQGRDTSDPVPTQADNLKVPNHHTPYYFQANHCSKADALYATDSAAILLNVDLGVAVSHIHLASGHVDILCPLNLRDIDSWLIPAGAYDPAANIVYMIVTRSDSQVLHIKFAGNPRMGPPTFEPDYFIFSKYHIATPLPLPLSSTFPCSSFLSQVISIRHQSNLRSNRGYS